MMVDKELVGRCGLYCGSCIFYRAERDSEELREEVAERNDCSVEEVSCQGCQSVLEDGWNGDEMWGQNCDIVRCLESKGLDTCYECETGCEDFEEWYEELLSYGEDLKENLERIGSREVVKWLKDEEEKWSCSNCGGPLIINLDCCHHCGEEVKSKNKK